VKTRTVKEICRDLNALENRIRSDSLKEGRIGTYLENYSKVQFHKDYRLSGINKLSLLDSLSNFADSAGYTETESKLMSPKLLNSDLFHPPQREKKVEIFSQKSEELRLSRSLFHAFK
jgi:hypothetical protein